MSLLHKGTETVTVFPEEVTTSPDGNVTTRPSAVGIVSKAVVQPITTSEDSDEGYQTSERLRLRLVGWQGDLLGAQSRVEWRGKRYSIHGEPKIFTGSRRTAHVDYEIRRT